MPRKESYRQLVLRYNKERQRNMLAKPGAHQFVLVLDQLKPGFNVGKIFRSAEAFGAGAVHLVDIGPFRPVSRERFVPQGPGSFPRELRRLPYRPGRARLQLLPARSGGGDITLCNGAAE